MKWLKKIFSFENDQQQANLVSAWLIAKEFESMTCVAISNLSNLPVYKMIISLVNVQNNASDGRYAPSLFRTYLSVIPPGKSYAMIELHQGMSFTPGIEIGFEDFNRRYWIRSGDNIVKSIVTPPYKYYNLTLPLSWEIPKQEMP